MNKYEALKMAIDLLESLKTGKETYAQSYIHVVCSMCEEALAEQEVQQDKGTMMKFRKKPVVIEAVQWFKKGDHPAVMESVKRPDGTIFCHNIICDDGGQGYTRTFAIPTLEGAHEVTEGDWIITGVKGEHYPCKPNIFGMTYEPATPAQDLDIVSLINKHRGERTFFDGELLGAFFTVGNLEGLVKEAIEQALKEKNND